MIGTTAAIIGSAVIGAGASMLAADSASSAAEKGADASLQATRESNALQKQIFETQRADLAPWRAVGTGALNIISDINGLPVEGSDNTDAGLAARRTGAMSRFFTDPGYEFSKAEGIQALDRSAAARGSLNSGQHGKALVRYGTGVANQQFGDWYNRISNAAGIGQTAVSQGNQAAQNYGNAAGANIINAGNQRASAYGAAGDAAAQGYGGVATSLNQGIGNYLFAQQMNATPALSPVTSTPMNSYFAGMR